jgi:hypothetical protein
MNISFDTNEDVEHLKELHALLARLIEKKGQGQNGNLSPSQSLPSEGMFAMFGEPTTQNPLPEQRTKEPLRESGSFRVIEY